MEKKMNFFRFAKYPLAGIFLFFCVSLTNAQPSIIAPDGYAAYAGTTGGGNATPVNVSSASDFTSIAGSDNAKVIIVHGNLNVGDFSVGSNTTIVGYDENAGLSGGRIRADGTNYIFQNLTFGPSSIDVMEVSGGTNVFITKCTFFDSGDELLSIVRQADYVTVSWCKFYYSNAQDHAFAHLIGNRDDATADRGKLHVTMHHNWYSKNVTERMPRVRYGYVHIYDDYYDCPNNNYCVGTGYECHIRLENSFFNNINVPWRDQSIGATESGGEMGWSNIQYSGCSEPTYISNSYPVFTPPYSFTVDPVSNVQSLVTAGAGNVISSSAVSVTGVSVSPASVTVGIGSTSQLSETVSPSNATNKSVSWSSSNTSVATVSSSGIVTGVASGSATITVTTNDGGYTATCNVTVSTIPVTSVSVSPVSASVGIGTTTQLTASVSPSNATNKSVSWSSNNTSIATVSSSGVVTGVALGSAVITATTQDGGYTATSNVTVTEYTLPEPLISLGFNENSGSSVSNTGSVSASFTKTDPPSWSTNVPTNGGASSVDFGTSTGDYYVESSSIISQLEGLSSFTVTGWVNNRNSSVGSGGNRIVSWINNGGDGVDIVYNSDGSLTTGINEWPDNSSAQSNSGKITTDANASASNWKFFAVTYDASSGSLSFYFGDNNNSASLDKTISYNQGAVGSDIGKLAIGHFNDVSKRTSRTDRMFRGLIDQVDIYGEVLSLSDIQTAQNIGTTTVSVTGVSVSPTSTSVNVGSTTQLTATVSPSNATNKTVSWSSGNTSVATVSSSGLVTGVAAGSATITVTTQDGNKTATSAITVNTVNVPVTGVSVSPTSASVNVGATTQLTATVAPSNASNQSVSWSSNNTSVATVSSSGLVTGVAAGSATITATTADGGYTATSNITVSASSLPTPLISLGFNENSGSSVANTGSVSASFTKTDPPSWSTNVPDNGGASSIDFGTSTGNYYVESSSIISQLEGLSSFTVTGWVNNRNSSVGSGGNRIVSWINNGGDGVDIVYNSDGSLTTGINEWPDNSSAQSNSGKVTTDANASASNWKFFAVTYDASSGSLSFYFGDNNNSASLDKTVSYNQGAVGSDIGKLAIGHFNDVSKRTSRTDRMFRGLIDQVAIYGSVLSLQDIQSAQNISGGGSTGQQTITIQENETGFCDVDGSIDNNNAGFTGTGFANTDNASGNAVEWAITGNGGTYTFRWRFASASSNDRTGVLSLNSNNVSTEDFNGTGSWTTWATTSVTLSNVASGNLLVRLEANQSEGLPNIDYLEVTGDGVSAISCSSVKSAEGQSLANAASDMNVTVYPNPANSTLNLKFSEIPSETTVIYILDMTGKPVMATQVNSQIQKLDISGLSNGLYIVRVLGSNVNIVKPFTKN